MRSSPCSAVLFLGACREITSDGLGFLHRSSAVLEALPSTKMARSAFNCLHDTELKKTIAFVYACVRSTWRRAIGSDRGWATPGSVIDPEVQVAAVVSGERDRESGRETDY